MNAFPPSGATSGHVRHHNYVEVEDILRDVIEREQFAVFAIENEKLGS